MAMEFSEGNDGEDSVSGLAVEVVGLLGWDMT